MHTWASKQKGFTIVELLIVIVVIAILAAISITVFSGVQKRARDSKRVSDMQIIVKALEMYKIRNGDYPNSGSMTGTASWEVSSDGSSATDFISALRTGGVVSKIPVDPINTVNQATAPNQTDWLDPGQANPQAYIYFYKYFGAGSYGCDPARGSYYILGVRVMESIPSGQVYPGSPGSQCAYGSTFTPWFTQGFQNG